MNRILRVLLVLTLSLLFSNCVRAEEYSERWCVSNSLYFTDRDCGASAGEVIQAYWAYLDPRLNYVDRSNRTYWGDNRASLDGCETKWPGPPPVIYCTVTHRYTQHTYENDVPLEFTPWQGWFTVVQLCGASTNTVYVASTGQCIGVAYREKSPCPTCQASNPLYGNTISPLDGIKHHSEGVLNWGRNHSFTLTYNYLRESISHPVNRSTQPAVGTVWFDNHHKSGLTAELGWERLNVFQREDGRWKTFFEHAGYIYNSSETDPQPRSASPSEFWYFDSSAGSVEVYQALRYGSLLRSVSFIDGRRLDYQRQDVPVGESAISVLESIVDESGRTLRLGYELVSADYGTLRMSSLTDPAGNKTSFSYDAKNQLKSIVFADGVSRNFEYLQQNKYWLMTGLVDETGSLFGKYEYDSEGRVVSTKTGTNGEEWKVEWIRPPKMVESSKLDTYSIVREFSFLQPSEARVFGPDGIEETLSSVQVDGVTFVASRTQPQSGTVGPATHTYERDSQGNITREVDVNGIQICRTFPDTRHLESVRVEGLSDGADCSLTASSGAALPSGTRKISSLWHPFWRKQVRIAEAGRVTTLVYNGQPDPTNGDAIASCAPSEAKLPDGSAIVVLCKRVEQATTDSNGALGFNATAQPGVPARVWNWTYDATGHVLTKTDPLGRTTTNEYYSDITADHWIGDLKSSTNAAGHVTNYLRYNAMGKLLEMIDANGISTVYTYDVRSRLTSVTQADQTTTYAYWPTGLLKQVTQPDGSTVNYDYDDAHRLVAVADNLGNRIQYTLDQRGNRTHEAVQDPSGTLTRNLSRVFDALSRTQQTIGAE